MRLKVCAVLLMAVVLFGASPVALAIDNQDYSGLFFLDDSGSASPQCAACRKAAYDRYNKTISDTCNSFPVNLFGWTKAICVNTATDVLAQDLTNCATDYNC